MSATQTSSLTGLAVRSVQPERMDDPQLCGREHRRALRGLARINRISSVERQFWRRIRALPRTAADAPLRVLDVACGGGDIAASLALRARAHGQAWTIEGCDISEQALAIARERAAARGAGVRFFRHDILGEPLPDSYDVITCALFLHHLGGEEAVAVLRRLAGAARRLLVVSDLRRCRLGLWAALWTPRVLTSSAVVWEDAVLSVRAAFVPAELRSIAQQAGLASARIVTCWPWRMLMEWRP